MKKGILTENAELAWRSALVYRDALLDGRDTLQNKKNFVSSLHNAVELFCKQRMIFDNNHSVIAVIDKDPEAKLAKKFYNSDDLDDFFSGLTTEDYKKIRSCDYKDLVLKNIFKQSNTLSKINERGGMKLLERLRNEETHFAFNDSFLSVSEFEILDTFLTDFYSLLQENELLPHYFGKRKPHIDSERNRLIPSYRKAEAGFSFKKQLEESKFAELFKKIINEQDFYIMVPDSYGIASAVYDQVIEQHYNYSFDEVFDYISSFQKYGFLDMHMNIQMEYDGYSDGFVDCPVFTINWKRNKK